MIREVHGDILTADAEALVNPVNTEGVAGAGLALQFRRKYPVMYREYVRACQPGRMHTGRVICHTIAPPHRFVISFPTKQAWRQPSKLEWIDEGLTDLALVIDYLSIRSIAIPPLGCGLGGLQWADVRELFEQRLGDLEVDVMLYAPEGAT